MGIRAAKNTKDHLSEAQGSELVLVHSAENLLCEPDGLQFFTAHPTKPCLVDLTVFAKGQQALPSGRKKWSGPFSGRPELIAEIAPSIRYKLLPLAEKSIDQYIFSLRAWWRLFDSVESELPSMQTVSSTAHLTDVHRQKALDIGMDRKIFSSFLRLANMTRTASLRLRQLYWQSPEDTEGLRHLAPSWQTDYVRHAMKHRWFSILDRWELADSLRLPISLSPQLSGDPELARLKRNYERFAETVHQTGNPRPPVTALRQGMTKKNFSQHGFSVSDMLRGSYPDGDDIRAAFHLCLATTGWNPAVLLSLDVTEGFIDTHPKDCARYIMRSLKARAGGAEQSTEGLFKTQGGAAFIVQTLIERTAPLREAARKELEQRHLELKAMLANGDPVAVSGPLLQHITVLETIVRSVWIYVTVATTDIGALSDNNFSASLSKSGRMYLGDLITKLNESLPAQRQLAMLMASDLRKAFATHNYRASGGSIFSVMKALNHRQANTSAIYLNNTLLNEEHRRLFSTFSEAMWSEMKSTGRVDPTILAKLSRDGMVTTGERERLTKYRTLMMSRVGTGCKDPLHPPRHIAPTFVADGQAMCHVQRCTLCVENAVVLPESLPGLCMRLAELRFLRSGMSVGAFHESSFLEELDNTELALLAFNQSQVLHHTKQWEEQISSGAHRVIEFDGLPRKDAQ